MFVLGFDRDVNIPSGCGIYGVYYRDIGWPTAGSHVLSLSLSFYQYILQVVSVKNQDNREPMTS